MTQGTLFGPGSRGGVIKEPVKKTRAPSAKPHWEELKLKHPPPCDRCVVHLHETWQDGVTPYVPPRSARHKRVHAGVTEVLCPVHADEQKIEDAKPSYEPIVRQPRRRYPRRP